MKKNSFLFILFLILTLGGCTGSNEPMPTVEAPSYDFLKASASVQQQETMRQQRDLAFNNAKYTLKSQVKNELKRFLTTYLSRIGLKNDALSEKLSAYVYMDMEKIFEAIEQTGITVGDERTMTVTAALNHELFITSLKAALKENFRRDRTVWDRFQEQNAQDLLQQSLGALLQIER